MPYCQLSIEEREDIATKKEAGWSDREIAAYLGRSASTIHRELKRHSPDGIYRAHRASRWALQKRQNRSSTKLNRCWDLIEEGLGLYWSPEQIAAWLEREHDQQVSYQAIYYQLHLRKSHRYRKALRRGFRRYRKRVEGRSKHQRIRDVKRISERPRIVERRRRFGDWESDTVFGPHRKSLIGVYVERRSRYVVLMRLKGREADVMNRATLRHFRKRKLRMRTLTVDNGMEYSMFKVLERRLGAQVYFAEPYKSWQRGTVENMNGLIRQFLPKGMDLSGVSQQQLNQIAELLNNRPRKILGFRTPAEVIAQAA